MTVGVGQPQTALSSGCLVPWKSYCGWDTLCLGFVKEAAGHPHVAWEELGEGVRGLVQPW